MQHDMSLQFIIEYYVTSFETSCYVCNFVYQGDSGGPLVIMEDNTAVIIGVVSFGATQCESGHPSVYTRVSQYIPWIHTKMIAHQ